jgi:peptidoglycan/LPS O-acetylase OafA/YrhL
MESRANSFDFLRLFAATLVILSHSFPLTGRAFEPYLWLSGTETLGDLAVDVFFIMSGFLIARSWLDDPRAHVYFAKRLLRLLPALAVVVALTVLVLGPLVTVLGARTYFSNPDTWRYFSNLLLYPLALYLPGVFRHTPYRSAVNGSLWSLPVEATMYLLDAVLGLCRVLGNARLLGTFVALMLGFEWYVRHDAALVDSTIGWVKLEPVLRLTVYYFTGSVIQVSGFRPRFALAPALGLALLLAATFRTSYQPFAQHVALPYFVFALAFAEIPWLRRFGRHGDFSYGTYLYAFPIQQTCVHFMPDLGPAGLFFVATPLTIGMAALSWHLVERPALALKKRFLVRPTGST